MIKLFLDAGHGGKDGGAQGNGLSEKTLTLEIVKKIAQRLKTFEGIELKLSRNSDITMSLSERTDMANAWGADYFLSVHINSAPDASANGFESFIYSNTSDAKTISFQNVVHGEIMKQIAGVKDRGKKRANLHVCRESKMPALLTENLFIINKSDALKLKDDEFLDRIAEGHVIGLEKFLGLKKSQQPPEAQPTPPKGKLYKVQLGAFASLENAQELARQVEKAGFKVFIDEQ